MLDGRTSTKAAYVSGNRLLDALPLNDRVDLEADLEIIALAAHKSTQSAGSVMGHVDFPIDAVLSVVASARRSVKSVEWSAG